MSAGPDDDALETLPAVHARALRLSFGGAKPRVIAEALGIEEVAVAPLLAVARAKLAAAAEDRVT